MGYNKDKFKRIREEYETKALLAQRAADARRQELEEKIPGLRELDARLSTFGLRVMKQALEGGNTQQAIKELQEENRKVLEIRRNLLLQYGYPEDYCKPHYECEKCNDSGYVGIQMCACMRRRLTDAAMESSGLGSLMSRQSFANFSLEYYRSSPEEYERMKQTLSKLQAYAANFSTNGDKPAPSSILLLGGTGLGKTHLSTSVAREVIELGFDVFYNTAVGMISDFEVRRFGNTMALGDADNTERYVACDLLILDDLGTEVVNQFTQSCLYYVLNSRLNLNRPTIISTNLKPDELRRTYADRITSRLMGEFLILPFYGTDIRKQKLK